ncbi:MAG: hypothetical protein AAB443_00315 [Patescibacteria group bacterium]
MKKNSRFAVTYLIVTLLLLISALLFFIYQSQRNKGNLLSPTNSVTSNWYETDVQPTIKETTESLNTYNSEAYSLISMYLDQYVYPKSKDGKSIYEYRINKISNVNKSEEQLTFSLVFSKGT